VRNARARLAWAIAAFAALALAWNAFATRFSPVEYGLFRIGDVFQQAGLHLARTLAELPPPALPRVVLFGGSQIAVVKSKVVDPTQTTPYRLHESLAERGVRTEVVDFSEGGQQLIESLLVYLASRERTQPDAVVMGVSLFNMLRVDVRPTLLADLDGAALRDQLRARIPAGADPAAVDGLLDWSHRADQRVVGRGQTIQQRMDDRIGDWLAAHTAAFANRQTMFDALIDRPVRRDLVRLVSRHLQQETTARTYEIGSGYGSALLALEAMQSVARDAGQVMLIVALPYDDTRPPIPFSPATQARVVGDLRAGAARTGAELLDLSHALTRERFRDFEDGSPDDLHYDEIGHATVAARIAEALAPMLAGRERR
jgi:hypothetical protein